MFTRPTRRAVVLGAAGIPFALRGALSAADNWLLTDRQELEAAKLKAAKIPSAKGALDDVLRSARQALTAKIELPDRGGQWPHWYSCKRDGVKLETVSPTLHRCPKCSAEYTGEPYDSVVLYGVHSAYARAIRDLGLAFRFTGDAAFARRAGDILSAYAAKYTTYKRHNTAGEDKIGGGRIMAQTLDESVWLIPAAWGYCLVRETLAAPQRERIENDLLVAAAEVIRDHRMSIHNIQCWKNSAVGCAGFAAGREDLIHDAIDNADRGFRVQIAKGVTDDGLWYEGSLGYHSYTMDALWPLAEAARRAGTDLYTDRMRSLWDAPLALAFPNGDPPGFNDNGGSNLTRLGNLYELGYARWQRAEYGRVAARSPRRNLQALLYGAENVPDGPMVPEESRLLKASGFAMLRSPNAVAAMRFGMHGGGHGHPDKLNLVTWGSGRMWGLDPGSINYGVPLHKEWYRSTIAHNTVSVDGGVQAEKDGRAVEWKASGGETTIAASADAAYPGVQLTRTVTVHGKSIDDTFECASDVPHVYDWAFHAPGKLTTSVDLRSGLKRLGETNGYQHIEELRSGNVMGVCLVRWEAEGASLSLCIEGAEGTEVFTGVGPGKNPAERIPMVIVRRRAARATFKVSHEFA
ncbi:MAG: heparinase II/III family protein [Candidatus Solibacter sp.]